MKFGRFLVALAGLVLLTASGIPATAFYANAAGLSGKYIAEDDSSLTMILTETPDGVITGIMTDPGQSMTISGKRQGSGFSGMLGISGDTIPFAAVMQDSRIVMDFGADEDDEQITFIPAGGAPAAAAAPAAASSSGQRNVVVNGQRLSDSEIDRIEQAYRVRIADANYWYDRISGAWGVKGSPSLGFIAPGIDLGGPLQPDASGGGTQIFVNGRELHPYDVMALQSITGPILPGRYFITALGLAGYEGGPPLWNLIALAAQAQAQNQGGGSNTWQSRITGASGFSDGTTSAVFLPNGGIVSTGQ